MTSGAYCIIQVLYIHSLQHGHGTLAKMQRELAQIMPLVLKRPAQLVTVDHVSITVYKVKTLELYLLLGFKILKQLLCAIKLHFDALQSYNKRQIVLFSDCAQLLSTLTNSDIWQEFLVHFLLVSMPKNYKLDGTLPFLPPHFKLQYLHQCSMSIAYKVCNSSTASQRDKNFISLFFFVTRLKPHYLGKQALHRKQHLSNF